MSGIKKTLHASTGDGLVRSRRTAKAGDHPARGRGTRSGDSSGPRQGGSHRLVNEAAEQYFVGNAQVLKQMEMIENSLRQNAKIVIAEHGISSTLLLGSLPVSVSSEKDARQALRFELSACRTSGGPMSPLHCRPVPPNRRRCRSRAFSIPSVSLRGRFAAPSRIWAELSPRRSPASFS